MSFNDFVHFYNLKNKATSNIKRYQDLRKMKLDSKVGIYLRDENFSTNFGMLNPHPTKKLRWVRYFKDCYFDS